MSLFDFFKKKKDEDNSSEILRALLQIQAEASKDGVDTDDIPTGYGPFGLCRTNPIPTRGIIGSEAYLSRLRTKNGRSIDHVRRGSTSATDVTSGMIDMYALTCDGESLGTVYLCPYHRRNSERAPEGFRLD